MENFENLLERGEQYRASSRVVQFPPRADPIDEMHIERLTSDLDRITAELMDYLNRPHSREIIGNDLFRIGLSAIRLNTLVESFK